MKKFEQYKKWIMAFVFSVAVIGVYKTFDNLYVILEAIKAVLKSLSPFLIGFIIAYILNIPATKIENACLKSKKKFVSSKGKAISIASVYLLMVLIIYVSIRAIAPALSRNIMDLYYNVPGYIEKAIAAIETFQAERDIVIFELNAKGITEALNKMLGKFDITEFSKYAKGVVDVTSGVIRVFIGIVVSVYMLIDKEKIKNSLKRVANILLKKEKAEKLINGVKTINNVFSKYLFCIIIDAALVAVVATIVLMLLKVKYAIILGVMLGVLNIIPYFGAIFAATISVIITLITGGFFQALWVAISLIVLQQIDGNFIGPKIMGEVLDASPLWIILAVTLGGGIFGVAGMVLSVPVLVTVKMAVTQFINEKEMKQSDD